MRNEVTHGPGGDHHQRESPKPCNQGDPGKQDAQRGSNSHTHSPDFKEEEKAPHPKKSPTSWKRIRQDSQHRPGRGRSCWSSVPGVPFDPQTALCN